MKKIVALGLILVGQAALADTPQLTMARDELAVRQDNLRYAEAEYRRSKANFITANKLVIMSEKAVKYYEKSEELSRKASITSLESHSNIGPTYQHEPRLADTGIRRIGK